VASSIAITESRVNSAALMIGVGRTFFGLALLALGAEHFVFREFVTARAPAWPAGVPGELAWVYGTGVLVVLAGLVAAAEAGALSGWWFGLFAVVAIFGAPGIAMVMDRRDARLADDTPLEWLGIDRPFTEDDVRAIDAVVALPQGAPR